MNHEFPPRVRPSVSVVVPCREDNVEVARLVHSLGRSVDVLEFLIVRPECPQSGLPARGIAAGSPDRKADGSSAAPGVFEREKRRPPTVVPPSTSGPVVRYLTAPLGRARQMNAGARSAEGSILLFLHADSRVTTAGIRELCQALKDSGSPAVAFRLRYRESGLALRLMEWGGRLLSATLGIGFGDQGLGMGRLEFFRSGMFPDVPILEDWFLNRRLHRTCGLLFLRSECETSARRFLRHGIGPQLWQNIRILYRGTHGGDLVELVREYESGPGFSRLNGRDAGVRSEAERGVESGLDADLEASGRGVRA